MSLPKVIMIVSADEEERSFFCEATGVIDSAIIRLNARSGQEAIHYLQQPHALIPEFIFLATSKSLQENEECLSKLRSMKRLSGSAIAVFSRYLSLDEQKRFDALGADFYLIKPTSLIQMISVLHYIFNRFLTLVSRRKPVQQLVA